jgi:signal peptidase I
MKQPPNNDEVRPDTADRGTTDEQPVQKPYTATLKKWAKEWIPSLLIAFVATFTVNTYVAQAFKVPSGSMEPTIQIDDRLIMEKMVSFTDFQFGDIIVFYPPLPEHEKYVKRLIGLPGDTIEIKGGYLYRNGQKIDEPYLSERMNYSYGPVTVPENKYFFLGDNRNDSYDSHLWPTPFVDKKEMIGKAILRYYPFTHVGLLPTRDAEPAS